MEIWKDIPGYEGKYQVSNLSNIKSLNYLRTGKEKILKIRINNKGYSYVGLYYNGKAKNFFIHRLIAQAFIPNLENKIEVNHKNGIRNDNRVENLEWVTHSENIQHCFTILGYKGSAYGKFGKDNPNSKKVNQYDLNGNFIKTWDSITQVGNFLKINYGDICSCCKGKLKTSGGFIWKYY